MILQCGSYCFAPFEKDIGFLLYIYIYIYPTHVITQLYKMTVLDASAHGFNGSDTKSSRSLWLLQIKVCFAGVTSVY